MRMGHDNDWFVQIVIECVIASIIFFWLVFELIDFFS